jgi:cation diffusion facilitator CzcD-associated flavoprotein CzcO
MPAGAGTTGLNGMTRGKSAPTIAIAGAGFGGIGLAVALKRAGIDSFTIYERAGDAGGVWRDNAYPGAACDVPSLLYSFSFAQDHDWTASFASQPEILAYLRRCVARFGLARHIRFNAEIAAASFDERAGAWHLETAEGERFDADVFISAVGLFNRPALPDIPGRDGFADLQFHSARWPAKCDLAGKRVAVIGTGASAIQIVPAIAPTVAKLHVFQRTPHHVLPRADPGLVGAGTRRERWRRRLKRFRIYLQFENAVRRRGSPRLTRKGERAFRAWLESQVADPTLRARLTPSFPLGCKRVLQSNDWYAALQLPNVELVDAPIESIGDDFIRTRDGRSHSVDVIVYCTGFTPTDYLVPMRVTGRGGRMLNEAWRDGAEAYLGITVAGFPNFFMLYGPNTNAVGSIITMLESQARYIVRAILALERSGGDFMDVRMAIQQDYNAAIQRRIGATVLVHPSCHSYFQTASGKVTTQWPGFMAEYRRRTRSVRLSDYEFGRASRASRRG